jgi:hypothetical protein
MHSVVVKKKSLTRCGVSGGQAHLPGPYMDNAESEGSVALIDVSDTTLLTAGEFG